MAITARDFITLAMKEAGVLGVGQSLLAEDVNDGFTYLERMLKVWQKRRWIVPYLTEVVALGNNQVSNKIGPGQYYNALRPNEIQSAYFIQLNTGNPIPVSYPLRRIFAKEDYDLINLKTLNTFPQRFFYDAAFPYGNVFIHPVPTPQYEIHLTVKGPIGFDNQISTGVISNAGSGYTNGTYLAVALQEVNGSGSGATADIAVAGGIVTTVTIDNPGNGYLINDFLTVPSSSIGGTGSGFQFQITNVVGTVDSVFNMPDEYQEAIHYNLAVRLSSAYQAPANPTTIALAKTSLATIRAANTQIPALVTPAGVRQGRQAGISIYDPDGYGVM